MDDARAREILGDSIAEDGGLFCNGQYLFWKPGEQTICLDAEFTADELEAMAWWMRNH